MKPSKKRMAYARRGRAVRLRSFVPSEIVMADPEEGAGHIVGVDDITTSMETSIRSVEVGLEGIVLNTLELNDWGPHAWVLWNDGRRLLISMRDLKSCQ